MTDTPSIHLYDSKNDDTFPVYFHAHTIPRVGDRIYYWVDYPQHMTREERGMVEVEQGEPRKVTGVVSAVRVEYRKMEYGNVLKMVEMIGVYLDDYKATLYLEGEQK